MRWPPLARGWGAHGRAARRQRRRLRRRDRHLAVWGGGPRRRRLPRCGPLPGTGTRGWPSWPFELRARLGSGPREKGMLVEGAHAASVHVSFQSCERKRLIAQEIGGGNRAGGSGRPPAASPGARRHGFGSPAKTEPPSSRRMVASPLSGGSARSIRGRTSPAHFRGDRIAQSQDRVQDQVRPPPGRTTRAEGAFERRSGRRWTRSGWHLSAGHPEAAGRPQEEREGS